MAYVKQNGCKDKFSVIAHSCLSCKCFQPGYYAHRAAAGAGMGSRNTGQVSACCLQNAYRGCPVPHEREASDELLKERKLEGWKPA